MLKIRSLRLPPSCVVTGAKTYYSLPIKTAICNFCTNQANGKHKTPLVDSILRRMKLQGPLTVADYMKECLIHPEHGYYMKEDVFGSKGDFITSPEISQIFGELIGVWIASEYQSIGNPSLLQIVELGPGRGTLSADILNTLRQFDFMNGKVSLHLIDISPKMREMQARNICGSQLSDSKNGLISSRGNVRVTWHNSIADVDFSGKCCFIAHEFFDALPIHKFQKVEDGDFHEVLIDIADDSSPHFFRQVLSPSPNANSRLFVKPGEERRHVEVSPLTGMVVQEIGSKLNEHGGFALIADYGHDGTKGDTFRGFKSHKLHDPLDSPGSADLTADVDFSFIGHCLSPLNVVCHGPVTQQAFLHNMGISVRLKALMTSPSTTEQAKTDLLTSYKMLCSPDEMGERFKFFSIHQSGHSQRPAGFS